MFIRIKLFILVSVFVLPGIASPAHAQRAKADARVDGAKAAAMGPGEKFYNTFTAVCKERKPGEHGAPTAAEPANLADRPIPTRTEWYVETRYHDNTEKKVAALKVRNSGVPHPYVEKGAVERYVT